MCLFYTKKSSKGTIFKIFSNFFKFCAFSMGIRPVNPSAPHPSARVDGSNPHRKGTIQRHFYIKNTFLMIFAIKNVVGVSEK